MEFSRDDLEGKKYQDLVKLAKEHDVYRRYAPKAELVERLVDLNKESRHDNRISDISMPSLPEVTDDSESENEENVAMVPESSNKKSQTLQSKSGAVVITPTNSQHNSSKGLPSGDIPEEDRRLTFQVPYERSILGELTIGANSSGSAPNRRTRRTIAVGTPDRSQALTNNTLTSSEHRPGPRLRRSTVVAPLKPTKTPAKSAKKTGLAISTPAVQGTSSRADDSFAALESAFGVCSSASPIVNSSPRPFRREGTFEIVSVDDAGKRTSHVVTTDVEPPFTSRSKRTRSSRGPSTPTGLDSSVEQSPSELTRSVKELRSLFESTTDRSRSFAKSAKSPNKQTVARASVSRSSAIPSTSRRSSNEMRSSRNSSLKYVLPSTANKVFVTNRAKPAGYLKPPSTKKRSLTKTIPKLKSPSVVKEIERKQQIVSAKKVTDPGSETKSKIPARRRIPNFSEMHAKMYSKMDSVVDVKEKIKKRALEHNNGNIPRCAVTPKLFSAEKPIQIDRPVDKRFDVRPAAVRKLLSPKATKIPKPGGLSPLAVVFGSPKLSTSRSEPEKAKPVRKLMPPNAVISRLPVLKPAGIGDSGMRSAPPPEIRQKMKETIVNKAPVKKVQDITRKNRQILQSVRTNKRFELQMQHRMKLLQK